MDSRSRWIWFTDTPLPDEYGDFRVVFPRLDGHCLLRISCDSDYAAYINGSLAAFGQYGDSPAQKIYDEICLDVFLQQGENELRITAWHYGVDTLTHIAKPAGARFEILRDNVVILASDESVDCRPNPNYIPHQCVWITPQLGLTFFYDSQVHDTAWTQAILANGLGDTLAPRPIQKLRLKERMPIRAVQSGGFWVQGGKTAAERMQHAALAARPVPDLYPQRRCGETGVYIILDLGSETAGFLDLDLEVSERCRIEIGWGEHLEDGRCRTAVRNFACTYFAAPGVNQYLNPFRRLGCRYLQLFIYAEKACVRYAGIRPTVYPVEPVPFSAGDPLRDQIYRTCVDTLLHCMHEHYEDCPWREQALYAMDSRNQMLCGYYAFGETVFARASLELLSLSVLPHGLLNLCAPAGWGYPIPSFSLIFFTQMKEYLDFSGDIAFIEAKYPMLVQLMQVFLTHPRENGLIENFYGPGDFWNFYEWAPGMEGRFHETQRAMEAPLNAFLSLALQALADIAERLGHTKDATAYQTESEAINRALRHCFFDRDTLLFHSFLDRDWDCYSVLTNSLCLLCGAAVSVNRQVICKILLANGPADTGFHVVSNTLSMNIFRFDALLQEDPTAFRAPILREIDTVYFAMLRQGATAFWETAKGAADFDGAGSLCHGWSALPICYYHRLLPSGGMAARGITGCLP